MNSGTIHELCRQEFDLSATLRSGQVFRWSQKPDGSWCGMLGNRRLRLRSSPHQNELYWEADGNNAEAAVRTFLRLDDFNLQEHGQHWSQIDPLFERAWTRQPGVRLLRQDPHECFFSFLCASVAPISRIRTMLNGIAQLVGTELGEDYVEFPCLEELSTLSVAQLRDIGLGFRAERVVLATQRLLDLPVTWLESLRGKPVEEIEHSLTAFSGVGRKIADCIALFSLDADQAVPVDTHIWRIARTHYLSPDAPSNLTPAFYQKVTDAFSARFGAHAGWAQQILFYGQAVGGDKIAPQ